MPIVGDVLADRYRIDGVLGAGGMASVYEATDLRLARRVAVKVLAQNLAADPAFASRFDREARAIAAFSHPNVVAVYDVDPGDPATGREPFYVMELGDGGSLADRIARAGRLPPGELVPVIKAVADGLDELHGNGLIHRDVKPHNIVFVGGRPKLADFGIARADGAPGETTLTVAGETVGTLAYLAPELFSGRPASKASDVYALGATAFQALTGRVPRSPASIDRLVESLAEPAPLVSSAAPDLGTMFDQPVASALATDPTSRTSASEFAAGLAAAATAAEAETEVGATVASAVARPNLPLAAADLEAPAAPIWQSRAAPASPSLDRIFTNWRVVLVAIGVVIIAIILLAGLSGLLFGGSAKGPAPSLPSASPLTSIAPSATPALTPAPSSSIPAALDAVDAAIQSARGGPDSLNGKDANELAGLAATVRQDMTTGNLAAALTDAQALADHAQQLTDKLDPARRDPLLAAIGGLIAALSAAG
jgi:serine/threonine protein kinase